MKRIETFVISLIGCVIFVLPNTSCSYSPGPQLKIISLEMHQEYGDSTLIKYENYEILVDGGKPDDANYVKEMINTYVEDKSLDLLITTHPHDDHIGGFVTTDPFSNLTSVNQIIDFGCSYGTYAYTRYVSTRNYLVTNKKATYTPITDVMKSNLKTINIAKDLKLDFLKSDLYLEPSKSLSGDPNDVSIGFVLSYKNYRLYMAGDATNESEKAFMKANKEFTTKDNIVIYKASHHSSTASNTFNFMNYIKPDYCFVSAAMVDENIPANLIAQVGSQHPHIDAIYRMTNHTTAKNVFWNGINGTLTFAFDGVNAPLISGKGRSKDYYYKDQTSQEIVMAIKEDEKNISYQDSKWYSIGAYYHNWRYLD